ncbi:hypothetical protein ACFQYP_19115 [Nonomuraea antimicrobica]
MTPHDPPAAPTAAAGPVITGTWTRLAPPVPYGRQRGPLAGHRAFTVVLGLAAALRVLTMLNYRPAQLFWYDSFTYLDTAVHLRPAVGFHPAGYPFLLALLRPSRASS